MKLLLSLLTLTLTLLNQSLVSATPYPLSLKPNNDLFHRHDHDDNDYTPTPSSSPSPSSTPTIAIHPASIARALRPLLSNGTFIFGPADDRWENATERYTTATIPDIEIVVQPAEESDIPIIVKYCNTHSIPFLAVNRGHAVTSDVARFHGLQIDLASLTKYTIQPDRKSAIFQGGSYGGSVIESLWEEGFVATTGACTCVSLLGPGLGGGHGRLEGQYGLVSDNILNLNMVLANGSAISVNATSHPDLWWGMQGAGHNFGIVTSFEMRIHPREVDTWHWHNYQWEGRYLETVFERLNEFHVSEDGGTPVLMANEFGDFTWNGTLGGDPVISWTFAYAGPAPDAEKHLAPFNAIPSLSSTSGDIPYPQIADAQGTGLNSASCTSMNLNWAASTVNLLRYNATAERAIFEQLKRNSALYPDLARNTRVVHEGYSNRAVQAVGDQSTAFALRGENHLMYIGIVVPPNSTSTMERTAWDIVTETKNLWNEGQPDREPTIYINYALGGEPIEQVYGEPWRIERLKGLKREYDPLNRFGFYNPIPL